MRLKEIKELLDCEVVWGEEHLNGKEVQTCFAADLMSDVLAFSQPGALLITGLISIQSAHTADVADLTAVVFVAGKKPAGPVLEMAREKQLPLLTTPHSMFETCGILHQAGLKPAWRT